MCIAIIKQKNVLLPDINILKNCFDNNSDGAGFAFNRNGLNYIFKGFNNVNELYKSLKEKTNISDIVFIHFRYATHGIKDEHNCHPFFCSEIKEANDCDENGACGDFDVMMHNGVLNIRSNEKNDSDSLTMAKKLYNTNCVIDNNKIIQSNNKIAILKLNGIFEIYGKWFLDDQLIFSNGTYLYNKDEESKKQFKHFEICDCCGKLLCKNYVTTSVGYHFCESCSKNNIFWHKCKRCGKKSTDFYCNECCEKFGIEENYFLGE